MPNNIQRQTPGPNDESVWDYPRPPRLELTDRPIQVIFNGVTIVETTNAKRILETSHPPTYYLPPEDVRMDLLTLVNRRTYCEFKGAASYYDLTVDGKTVQNAAWTYQQPNPGYEAVKNHLCFYASKMDACYVSGEKVQSQEGDFYGGWITSWVVGPFKGGPGTRGW
ncbi:MAG: DUF427 domain-containing protein [Chloroflexota bacterium]